MLNLPEFPTPGSQHPRANQRAVEVIILGPLGYLGRSKGQGDLAITPASDSKIIFLTLAPPIILCSAGIKQPKNIFLNVFFSDNFLNVVFRQHISFH